MSRTHCDTIATPPWAPVIYLQSSLQSFSWQHARRGEEASGRNNGSVGTYPPWLPNGHRPPANMLARLPARPSICFLRDSHHNTPCNTRMTVRGYWHHGGALLVVLSALLALHLPPHAAAWPAGWQQGDSEQEGALRGADCPTLRLARQVFYNKIPKAGSSTVLERLRLINLSKDRHNGGRFWWLRYAAAWWGITVLRGGRQTDRQTDRQTYGTGALFACMRACMVQLTWTCGPSSCTTRQALTHGRCRNNRLTCSRPPSHAVWLQRRISSVPGCSVTRLWATGPTGWFPS